MEKQKKIKVLFVCMGNICRSPTAHGIFQALVKREGLEDLIFVDSAGTHSYHVGSPPDLRSQATALAHNVDLSRQSARRFQSADFDEFDYVIGMDNSNIADMLSIRPDGSNKEARLMLEFSSKSEQKQVPDPYFGEDGFEQVYELIDDAAQGLLASIREQHHI